MICTLHKVSVFLSVVHDGVGHDGLLFLVHLIENEMVLHDQDAIPLLFQDGVERHCPGIGEVGQVHDGGFQLVQIPLIITRSFLHVLCKIEAQRPHGSIIR